MKRTSLKLALLMAVLALVAAACGGDEGGDDETFTLGVSNTLVGNAWREQMVCAIQAEALASGVVDEVVLANRNAGTPEQIADIQGLISQGVDAIIVNPSDREALNPVLEEAIAQDIVVVSIDQGVTAEGAFIVTNDQVAYGELGARWLFDALGGEGDVLYMRGIDGVPADTDRDAGFQAALADYPGINIVAETFTGWDPTQGAQQALDVLGAQNVDGIWTSGIDYTVVEQFTVAGVDPVPVVGADNNAFIGQLIAGQPGSAVTNPPAVGGVGAAIAIQALQGEDPELVTTLTPEVFDEAGEFEEVFVEDLPAGWSSFIEIEPYTTYSTEQVIACEGPSA